MIRNVTTSVGASSGHTGKTTGLLVLMLVVSVPVFGQGLKKKYESQMGLSLNFDKITWTYDDRMDFDGDGRPEWVLERVDEQGKRIEFLVVRQEDRSVLWQLGEEELETLGLDTEVPFLGFFSLGSDLPSSGVVVFGGRAAGFLQGIDPATNQSLFVFPGPPPRHMSKAASADTLQYALFDVDGDDYVDLIFNDPVTQTVQVWGIEATGTATEADIETALLRLFASYPNPFLTSTTISYALDQAGPVRLTVYDALGREVRTLVDGQQAVGWHAVVWDGRDAEGQAVASGMYFYRLRVGEAVTSRQAIRVK